MCFIYKYRITVHLKKNIKMVKKILFINLILFQIVTINAQTVLGKVIHKNSDEPIEKAAIITNIKKGTTSDKFGEFTLDIINTNTITISCLGYESKTISKKEFIDNNFIVKLTENINQLEEFELNLTKIELDSLLKKTSIQMKENYLSSPVKLDVYSIENQLLDFKKLDLEVKSSSILNKEKRKNAEKELTQFANKLKKRNPSFRSEFKSTITNDIFYSEKIKKNIESYQIENVQGFKNLATGNDITVENVTKKLQNIVLKHLDTNYTYKLKSGIFKVEDSLSLAKTIKSVASMAKDTTFNNYNQVFPLKDIKKQSLSFNLSSKNNFLDKKYYKHKLEVNEILGAKKYYVISFRPNKLKSKYSGKIYIDPSDYYIKKIAYSYAKGKRGEHLNLKFLLGIKFSKNTHNTTLFYEKNKEDKIYASYKSETTLNYAYIDRPLKFIENSSDKNKVKFNIKLEIKVSDVRETLVNNVSNYEPKVSKDKTKEELEKKLLKRTPFMTKDDYETSNWKNRKLIKKYLEKYN